MGAADVTQLINALSPLLLDSKKTVTRQVSPQLTGQFNELFSSLLPNAQGGGLTDADLDALLKSIMTQGQRSFAPNQAVQAGTGGYNSTSLEALRGDAMAKATDQSLQALVNAKLQAGQNQNQAGQVLSQLLGTQANSSFSETTKGAAPLGGIAAPLAGYAIVKQLMGDGGLLGKAGGVADTGAAISPVITGQSIFQGSAPAVASATASLAPIGSSVLDTASLLTPGVGAATSGVKAASELDDIVSLLGDTGSTASGAGATSSVITSAASPLAFSAVDSGAGAAAGTVAGTADAASNVGGFFDSNNSLLSGVGGLFSSGLDAIESIPYIGSGIASTLGAVGEGVQAVGDFFTPTFNVPGLGPTGIPLLAGVGNFMEGDYAQGVGDIGATMALNAIPGIGTALALISGFTSNGVLDDWFGIEDCYITTATMAATGNSDDSSYELTTMRKFRDEFMKATPAGKELIANYYEVAPKVVAKLNNREDAKEVYANIYHRYLAPAIAAIETGNNYAALSIYREMSQHAEALAAS